MRSLSVLVMSVTLFCLLFATCLAFLSKDDRMRAIPRSSSTSLVLWSFQKIGQSVLGTSSIPPKPASELRNPVSQPKDINSGEDERFSSATTSTSSTTNMSLGTDTIHLNSIRSTKEIKDSVKTMSRRWSLLKSLQSSTIAAEDKIQMIRLAASPQVGILPETFAEDKIRTQNLLANGLMDSWNFDIIKED